MLHLTEDLCGNCVRGVQRLTVSMFRSRHIILYRSSFSPKYNKKVAFKCQNAVRFKENQKNK